METDGEALATRRARAREALTRIRLRRAVERQRLVRDLLGGALLILPGVVVLGGHAALGALGVDLGSTTSFTLGSTFLPLVFAAILGGLGAELLALLALCSAVSLAPWWLYKGWRAWRAARVRREAERLLEETGEVPAAWSANDREREAALDALAAGDEGLVRTRGGGLRPLDEGPPESCPDCGAPLVVPGEGLRRCEHCDFERYDELPGTPVAVARARNVLVGMGQDGGALATPAERWATFLGSFHAKEHLARRRRVVAVYGVGVGVGVVWDLVHHGLGLQGPMPGILIGLVLVGVELFLAYELIRAVWEYYDLRFRQFSPGSAAYDAALFTELIRAVALKGRARLDDVAAHLGVSRAHLEQVIASLSLLGLAPLYRDRRDDTLISLHAREVGDNNCPVCGGDLEIAPNVRVVCGHCGSEALGPLTA